MRHALLATALVAASGCYNPSITDNQFLCSAGNDCPQGFVCACGKCVSPGKSASCDMGEAPGDGMMGMGVGCSNGTRAAGDPRLGRVAACPAAWTVPGLTSPVARATPCNRRPTANGMAGTTRCTAEDNCAPGWHVCESELELGARGFQKSHCDMLSMQPQLFVTRQAGGPPATMMGPPECTAVASRTVFGCGTYGNAPNSCTLHNRVLVDKPDDPADDCSAQSSGTFLCTGSNVANPEATVVTKPALGGGGVLCCTD